jgi:NhaP-type Na+/H+ or K+/H+ antiporter
MLKHFANTTKIPYTPIICLAGILVALIPDFRHMTVIEDAITKMDPSFMLFLFLPALIFESAFSTDWHTFTVQLPKIIIMAVPIMGIAIYLTALIMFYLLNGTGAAEMPFEACILFGAIVSATDPVAVVSLLKELGAPKQLATMIEGESLLNDGTAFVVFLIAKDLLLGKCIPPLVMGGTFLRLAFGGVLLGLISAEFLKLWLGRLHNQPVLEVNLTICFTYLTFFVAEIPTIHVSGILAVVTLGLWMAREGKTTISHDSEQAVHSVWSVLGFGAETLVFLLAGIMIGYHNIISFENVGKSIVLWICLVIIRFVLLMMFLPCMQRMGYKMDWRHAALMTWGGLRGALAVFLALIVVNEKGIKKEIS